MGKEKTLADYITTGRHEFVAFVHDVHSRDSSNHNTLGNLLGKIHLGVLVCDAERDCDVRATFFYKSPPKYKESDIVCGTFGFKARVVSEVPLSLSTMFFGNQHLESRSEEFHKAKKLMERYGLY